MPKQAKEKPIKPVRAYAGISDGKLHGWRNDDFPHYEIYFRKADAKRHYTSVVPVLITPLKAVQDHATMALSRIEREIIAELHGLIGTKIREKDLLEWRTRELQAQPGECIFHLPDAGVWVAIPDTVKIKKPQ